MTTRGWIKHLIAWGGVAAALGMLGVLASALAWHPPNEVWLVSPIMLLVSVIAMLVGLVFQYVVWHLMVRLGNPAIGYRQTFSAHALAIWAKYIPGKVWSVLGRAGYLAKASGIPIKNAVAASTGAQLIMLMTGCFIAAPVILQQVLPRMIGGSHNLTLWSVLIVVLLLAGLWICLLGRARTLDLAAIVQVVLAGFSAVVVWLAWGFSLTALVTSLGKSIEVLTAIGQYAAGVCAGIVSVVVPGGLGVREGVLSFLLVLDGYHVGEAATIGILLRVVSLAGEFLIFVVGLASAASGAIGSRR